jgi:hypothetical protein
MSEEPKPQPTKEELFKENPDHFVNINDLIIATQSTPEGLSVFINIHKHRGELTRSIGELQVEVMREIGRRAMIEQKNKIAPPHGMINHARNIFGRK